MTYHYAEDDVMLHIFVKYQMRLIKPWSNPSSIIERHKEGALLIVLLV
jgi:hypothetical protein